MPSLVWNLRGGGSSRFQGRRLLKLGESGMKLLEEDPHARSAIGYEKCIRCLHELLAVKVRKSTIRRLVARLD
jgi:hypothetical protein